eukprot:scaffold2720_cov212-Pinguiococcus_pyrenoidosus.AAC.2
MVFTKPLVPAEFEPSNSNSVTTGVDHAFRSEGRITIERVRTKLISRQNQFGFERRRISTAQSTISSCDDHVINTNVPTLFDEHRHHGLSLLPDHRVPGRLPHQAKHELRGDHQHPAHHVYASVQSII